MNALPRTAAECVFESTAPQFVVRDVRAAAEHYRDALGFAVTSCVGDPPAHAILRRGGCELMLIRAVAGPAAPNRRANPIAFDAYLRLRGLDACAAELRARGARIVEGPVLRAYGMRELMVEDLDGHLLAFAEPAAD